MATTKKGWRRITVDGKQFRWMIRREATYTDMCAFAGMKFVVESASGTLLIVNLTRHRVDPWLNMGDTKYFEPVTPNEVANWIRKAVALDWNPEIKTKPLVLHE